MRWFVAAVILAALAVNVVAQPTPKGKAPVKTAAAKPAVVTVTGVLTDDPGGDLFPPRVFPVAVGPEEENAKEVTVTTEALNQYGATPDKTGAFRLKVERSFLPPGKKLKLMIMFLDGRGLRSLYAGTAPVLTTLETKTGTIDVGKVTFTAPEKK